MIEISRTVSSRRAWLPRFARAALLCAGIVLGLGLVLGTAACDKPVAPHVAATSTTAAGAGSSEATGVDKEKFNKAWDQVKEIVVATSVAAARPALVEQVQKLRDMLDAIPKVSLNPDERAVLADFDWVYWAYADGLALWTALIEADGDFEGIPVARDGVPLFPRAETLAAAYGLTLERSIKNPAIEYVAENSIDKLWEIAYKAAQNELLPIFRRWG